MYGLISPHHSFTLSLLLDILHPLGVELPYEKVGDALWKTWIEPTKESIVIVAQALVDS